MGYRKVVNQKSSLLNLFASRTLTCNIDPNLANWWATCKMFTKVPNLTNFRAWLLWIVKVRSIKELSLFIKETRKVWKCPWFRLVKLTNLAWNRIISSRIRVTYISFNPKGALTFMGLKISGMRKMRTKQFDGSYPNMIEMKPQAGKVTFYPK